MKKVLVAAALMLLTMGALSAQNTFRGIVRFSLTSSGKVDMQIPAEASVVEMKVFENQLMLGTTVQNGLKVAQAIDFGPYIQYLDMQGIELETYRGDAKFIIRDEATKESLDSIYLPDTEAGHFYYELVDGTKDILGYTAHKMIMHRYDEEGNDNPMECWYTTEIGPEYCVLMGNMKGFPLVLTQDVGEGRAITYTAVEVVKGKVSKADMLMPAGYKEASKEELEQFQEELKDAMELLGD